MGSKEKFRASIKSARKELRYKRKVARAEYKQEVRKHRLFLEQAQVKEELKEMGVANRQIPVQIINSRAQTIKVRVL